MFILGLIIGIMVGGIIGIFSMALFQISKIDN